MTPGRDFTEGGGGGWRCVPASPVAGKLEQSSLAQVRRQRSSEVMLQGRTYAHKAGIHTSPGNRNFLSRWPEHPGGEGSDTIHFIRKTQGSWGCASLPGVQIPAPPLTDFVTPGNCWYLQGLSFPSVWENPSTRHAKYEATRESRSLVWPKALRKRP